MRRPSRVVLLVHIALALTLAPASAPLLAQTSAGLPARLTDRDFWELSQALAEPDGTFGSDNLLTNEFGFQKVLPALSDRHGVGGVYIGVGPEQNFTYVGALQPRIAFIVDIRRGNRDLHLMYKALFELAADRAEFVSLLFSRVRPDGLTAQSSVTEIFTAIATASGSETGYRANLARVKERLTQTHQWPLSDAELRGIESVYEKFFQFGPDITYASSRLANRPGTHLIASFQGTYATMMQATDANEAPGSYLFAEARFVVVKDLHARNLIVPVVGDFAGPKALRSIGDWLRARGATVSAFYLSNVEDYLRSSGTWGRFCQNISTMPVDGKSDFIRSSGTGRPPRPLLTPGGLPGVVAFAGSGDSVMLRYSDGTSRSVTEEEALKELQRSRVIIPNRLEPIVSDLKLCR